jgi:hypothetical protein
MLMEMVSSASPVKNMEGGLYAALIGFADNFD